MSLINKPFIFFILFLIIASGNAFAAGDSINTSGSDQSDLVFFQTDHDALVSVPNYPESTTRMDVFVFWELPTWVQITYLSLVAAAVLGLLKAAPFVFGRLKSALENPKTKDIFFSIQNNPGLTITQLSEKEHINRGTLRYHLSQLFSNNKITLVRRGKVSQLYHNTLSPMDKESVIASYLRRKDNSQAILFTIMDNPGVTNKDLSERFDLDKSTITDYVKKFSEDEIVELRQDGKYKRCYVKQEARMILLRYKAN
jgi:predicted transcriptional regulator